MRRSLLLVLMLAASAPLHAQSRSLEIYWIDVEGGAATLIVSPSGESMLIDTGWEADDRDAKRILAAAQHAGVKKIDYLVISLDVSQASGVAISNTQGVDDRVRRRRSECVGIRRDK